MENMTDAEWRAFVSAGTRTGKLAVQRANGRPHVTPVWFLLDETDPDDVRLVWNTGSAGVKGRALGRDPHFAMCVDDQQFPYSFVLLECTAELSEDPGPMTEWATRIATRYVGPELGPKVGEANAAPGEYLVVGRIDRVTANRAVAG